MKQLKNGVFKSVVACMILFSLALGSMVFAEPYFSIDDPIDWQEALADGSVKPIDNIQWNEYMPQWQEFLVEGEPYPQNEFFPPDLYVYGGSGENDDVGGLVMTWGEENVPTGSYSSAWIYDYGVDPDLTNCTITITVVAPQFSNTNGSQINAVSLGMRDVNGSVRAWQWSCGPAGSGAAIQWFVPTTITINTSLTGIAEGRE